MLPPMFVSEPDTTAPSPWISPARPHLQFSRSPTLPLCLSARYCYFMAHKLALTLGEQPGAHTRSGGWGLPGLEPLSGPDGQWEGPMLRVSCRLAFFLKFPERNPWPLLFSFD